MKILIALGDLRFDDTSKIINSIGGKESLFLPSNIEVGDLMLGNFCLEFSFARTRSIRQPPMPFVLRSPSDCGRFGFIFFPGKNPGKTSVFGAVLEKRSLFMKIKPNHMPTQIIINIISSYVFMVTIRMRKSNKKVATL